ncbi:hypothetical protein ACFWIB_39790 [Streptomyces sp. NPDC127051]
MTSRPHRAMGVLIAAGLLATGCSAGGANGVAGKVPMPPDI